MHNDAVHDGAHYVDRDHPANSNALRPCPHQVASDRSHCQKSYRQSFVMRTWLSHPSTDSAKFGHLLGSMAAANKKMKWIGD